MEAYLMLLLFIADGVASQVESASKSDRTVIFGNRDSPFTICRLLRTYITSLKIYKDVEKLLRNSSILSKAMERMTCCVLTFSNNATPNVESILLLIS